MGQTPSYPQWIWKYSKCTVVAIINWIELFLTFDGLGINKVTDLLKGVKLKTRILQMMTWKSLLRVVWRFALADFNRHRERDFQFLVFRRTTCDFLRFRLVKLMKILSHTTHPFKSFSRPVDEKNTLKYRTVFNIISFSVFWNWPWLFFGRLQDLLYHDVIQNIDS